MPWAGRIIIMYGGISETGRKYIEKGFLRLPNFANSDIVVDKCQNWMV